MTWGHGFFDSWRTGLRSSNSQNAEQKMRYQQVGYQDQHHMIHMVLKCWLAGFATWCHVFKEFLSSSPHQVTFGIILTFQKGASLLAFYLTFWRSIWHSVWRSIWTSIWPFIWQYSIWHIFCYSIRHSIFHIVLTFQKTLWYKFFVIFYLTSSLLTYFLAYNFWHSFWHSFGSRHGPLRPQAEAANGRVREGGGRWSTVPNPLRPHLVGIHLTSRWG